MARLTAITALVLAFGAAALAIAGPPRLGGGDEGGWTGVAGSGPAVYPGLRALAAIDGTQVDSGAGVYPALAPSGSFGRPGDDALANARAFAATRRGAIAFALADEGGGVRGIGLRRRFASASLTKAMILVAFLRRRAAERRALSAYELASLGYMIRISDNGSADVIYRRTGDAALRRLARSAGMRDFAIAGNWAQATMTAADQARFFLALDRLSPPRYRRLVLDLTATITAAHSWGAPAALRPAGWRVFFKGGWRPGASGDVVHQGALLERGARRFALAVMTKDNPGQAYGEQTIAGVARRLFARIR